MTDKLSEDELLNRLRMFKAWICTPGHKEWTDDNEQAYRQIAEIIGGYFRFLRETTLKPQVTEEWIAEKADLIYRRVITYKENINIYSLVEVIKESIRSLVEEIRGK